VPLPRGSDVCAPQRHGRHARQTWCGDSPPLPGTTLESVVNTVVRGHRLDLLQVDVELSSEGSDDVRRRRPVRVRRPVEVRQQRLDVAARAVPADQSGHGEAVASVMESGTACSGPGRRLEPGSAHEFGEGLLKAALAWRNSACGPPPWPRANHRTSDWLALLVHKLTPIVQSGARLPLPG